VKPTHWKKLSSRDIVRDSWVRLRADRCEIAPGRILDPFYVLEEHEWVHAIALNRAQEVLLVRQYRYPVDAFTWELPGGWVNPGEDLLAAAQRELREETGATAPRWRHVASPFPNPARQTNRVHGFLAEDTVIDRPAEPDASEAVTCAFFPIAAVRDLIRDGSFSQANHIALFYLALERLGRIAHRPTPSTP
jgi:8-oxo-dGTP pyrophosphatase MutT (NUDIX family)